MLTSAFQQVIDDNGFKNSAIAINAQQLAQDIKSWSAENKDEFEEFGKILMMKMEKVFIGTVGTKKSIINRDKLWRNYFLLRSSKHFTEEWEKFLDSVPTSNSKSSQPLLYQRLTDIIFKELIKEHYQICDESTKEASLDERESNALRYVAAYVCRNLRRKLERLKGSQKEEMILCLMTLTKGGEFEEGLGTAEDWTELVDRGGLWRVRENTFHLFCAIEEMVQLQLKSLPKQTVFKTKEVIAAVTADDDVQFYWLIVAADFEIEDTDVHSELLYKIIELYLTIRGHSYCSMWLEHYKQREQKNTQRSKGLRKELYSSHSE